MKPRPLTDSQLVAEVYKKAGVLPEDTEADEFVPSDFAPIVLCRSNHWMSRLIRWFGSLRWGSHR